MCSSTQSDILFETRNGCGIITLNKPKTLNAVNKAMAELIGKQLEQWENDVSLVMIRGTGGKAFCAGGDIKESVEGGPTKCAPAKQFFKQDYTNDYRIATYRVPYVAIMDGITMGSGAGLSVNARYRVATEKTLFAMPETAIGLFPDCGASYFLPRLQGHLGMFLALTGHRLKGQDVAAVGLATHYCPSDQVESLMEKLLTARGDPESVLNSIARPPQGATALAPHLQLIDRVFSKPTVEEMVTALEQDQSEWAQGVLATLNKMSPLSLKVTHREMLLGKKLSIKECLQMEYRICSTALEADLSKDFYEGVRALLIDKDKKPKWSPSKLDQVPQEMVDSYFKKLPPEEEMALW